MSKTKNSEALTIEKRDDIAIVSMDIPGESMNTLQAGFADVFADVFTKLAVDDSIKAVVFTSGKPDSFIAGADIKMLEAAKTRNEAEQLSRDGQDAMQRLEDFPKPIVAAIHGTCLGGGLEVALACHSRVCSDHKKTKLGLPESQLGLLPGAGGTQRLPQLIGAQAALDLMLTGKQIPAKKAKSLGLVDAVAPKAILLDVAVKKARELAKGKSARKSKSFLDRLFDKNEVMEMALAENPLGRRVLFDQARKKLHEKTRGNYPAQDAILDVVREGLSNGLRAGYEAEAKQFGRLVMSDESKALRSIFFATTAIKKDSGVDKVRVKPIDINKVGMLGAGLMGAGIAYVTTSIAKTPVRLKDRNADGLLAGMRYVQKIVDKRVKRRRMSKEDAKQLVAMTTPTTDYSGFDNCEVVIEAVFEDLDLKRSILQEVEAAGLPKVIFASNTSALPISKIAEASQHPETVIGMHYFSPVEKMPLLEIIVTKDTADWVTATCVKLGKKQGKTVIVVKDGVGFYTTRILAPLMNEAAHILAEGVAIDRIDNAMMDFGYPVGPIKLTDEVGIDVGAKVGKVMIEAFGDRLSAPAGIEKLIDAGRKGRKNKSGFYLYGEKQKGVDASVYDVLGVSPTNTSITAEEIAWRCTLMMVNEAVHCFSEGILRSARDGDIGAIFGLGFPPFRGGPFRFVDAHGAREIVAQMEKYQAVYGKRFAPAQLLHYMAQSSATFHGDNPVKPGKKYKMAKKPEARV